MDNHVDDLESYLSGAEVASDVWDLRPDYRAMLLAVDGIEPGPSDTASEALLLAAEASARAALADTSVDDLPPLAAGREACRATGSESFDTTADGVEVIEHPEPGEVVWCDDAGVTCRRWNWRQARRTQLHDGTTSALFIIDVLDPVTDAEVMVVTDELIGHLCSLGPAVQVAQRLLQRS